MKNKRKTILIGLLIVFLIAVSLVNQQVSQDSEGEEGEKGSPIGRDYIAVIRVDGPIVGNESPAGLLSNGESASSARLMSEFRRARRDNRARAVLLRINSPGGSATASQEIGDEMARLRQAGKKIIVSMGDSCASGGYWLAANSDYIYANPSTLTGSIGVYIGYTNYEELMNKIGVHSEKIKSGAHKDILDPNRPMTAEERALVQGMVNDIYEQFLDVVANGRHMDREAVRRLADGRILTGRQAMDAGLVDAMGNYYDALAYTAEQVGMDPDKPVVREYSSGNSLQKIFSLEMQNAISQGILNALHAALPTTGAQTETEVPHVR